MFNGDTTMCSTAKVGGALKAPSLLPTIPVNSGLFRSSLRESNNNVERLQQQRQLAFEAKEPEYHLQFELNDLPSPLHLFKLKQLLKQLKTNQTLKISSLSSIMIKEFQAASNIMNFSASTLTFRKLNNIYITPHTH